LATQNLRIYVLITISVLLVIGVINYSGWAFLPSVSASQDLMSVLPGIMITFLGLGVASGVKRSPAMVGACAVAGLGLALLIDELNVAGILLVANMGGWTVYQIQVLVLVASFLFGAIVYYKN